MADWQARGEAERQRALREKAAAAELRLRDETARLKRECETAGKLKSAAEADLKKLRMSKGAHSPAIRSPDQLAPASYDSSSSLLGGSVPASLSDDVARPRGVGLAIRFVVKFAKEGWRGGGEAARRALAVAAGLSETR